MKKLALLVLALAFAAPNGASATSHSLVSCDLRERAKRPEWRSRCITFNMNSRISAAIFRRMKADCESHGGVLVRGMWCPTTPTTAACELLRDPYGVPGGGIIKEYQHKPYPEFRRECEESGNWYHAPSE